MLVYGNFTPDVNRCLISSIMHTEFQFPAQEALAAERAYYEQLLIGNRNEPDFKPDNEWMRLCDGKPFHFDLARKIEITHVIGCNYVLELPRLQSQTSQISYLCEICDIYDISSGNIYMLVSNLIHQNLYPGLLDPYNLGYYVELYSCTIAGKTWMSLTLETSHDPAYAERCIDLFFSSYSSYPGFYARGRTFPAKGVCFE